MILAIGFVVGSWIGVLLYVVARAICPDLDFPRSPVNRLVAREIRRYDRAVSKEQRMREVR